MRQVLIAITILFFITSSISAAEAPKPEAAKVVAPEAPKELTSYKLEIAPVELQAIVSALQSAPLPLNVSYPLLQKIGEAVRAQQARLQR